ncbi:MAG: hypothetical protein JWL71_4377 [Acidobacteria bacterium]|nr:hypothetical protein [Acidobacteriota bacterium]
MKVGSVLLVIALAAALSVDVVKTGFGLKGDEATYVSMALSLAYDHDLTYERRDLDRFFGLYRSGPDGIFLKKGKHLRVRADAQPPFVHTIKSADNQPGRLYFAKALLYPIVAAPFVRLLGLNGFLVLHVLLLFGVCVCGYKFLAARSQPAPALIFTLAFVGATCVPVYTVFLAPEILHFSLIFFAYFLWLYKEVKPDAPSWLRGRGSDIAAAMLLGAATYSKPPNHALLVAPLVLWLMWRRKWLDGLLVGAVSVAVACLFFGVTAINAGEFNYQGGDRKTFYTAFPFDGSKDSVWDRKGTEMSTNDSDAENVLQDFPNRFAHNVEYFLVGRHFGFVPYFFPGVVAITLWLCSSERRRPWRVLIALAVLGSAVGLLILAPYSWSGGGGPTGNRYIIGAYAALFFLTPPMTSSAAAILAWVGGALFTAKMLVNPFVAAKSPYLTTERGFARYLPVEITMANDLPVMLIEGPRAHAWFNDVLLYFLDEHAYPPEQIDAAGHTGVWIAGDGRADIIMRSDWAIDHLRMTVESPVATVFIASAGGRQMRLPLTPGTPATFDLPAVGVRDATSWAYLLSARSTEGFTEHLRNPESKDYRNLGALMRFTAAPAVK